MKLKGNKKRHFKPYEIKLRDLIKGEANETIWAIDNDLILNVKYEIYDEKLQIPGIII